MAFSTEKTMETYKCNRLAGFLSFSLLRAPWCALVVKFSVSFVIAHISNFSLINLLVS
jgi:hypothetical protein